MKLYWVAGLCAVIGAGLAGAGAIAGANAPHIRVSQKEQAFHPGAITIAKGTVVDIVNDDGDLLHHAYIDSSTMKFDSGDQEPGQTASIPFDATGTFQVLCGIHPRMKLRVIVEPQ